MIRDFERTTTERLLLRRLQESDLDAVFTLHADPETNRFDSSGSLSSLDDARELLARWLGNWASHGVGYWAVERRDAPGTVVGFGGVRHKELEGQRVLNLAYRFSPQCWGSGYATEMARVALALAQKHIPDVPVVAIIHLENAPSLRVVERLGMRRDRVIDYEGIASAVYLAA
ncbi:GNAT family N-acetyltransferase [Vitiosangium sp. GDMCC 1.1324]|uniref:GNAT family N-acetyltransferase n=1 Tax=Vitiosangium sp. (strain GDMCC 1.1324) TaxID=2138576 RepID=UPI000D39806B|nr:GNAT family N-acetyltransferase [Vitiosangium sp. GDMCC 1.1324]PTL82153.1 N-acetyltransferase [Vitiosangium sp. GDMCC 1.1324]